MATTKEVKVKNKTPKVTPPIVVDMNIIEYFYAATYEDIMSDDKLVDLILTNGYYKEAFCDAHQIDKLVIGHKNKDHKFKGSPHSVRSTLDVLQGNSKYMVLNTIFKNVKLENINKVTPLEDYADSQ